MISRRAFTPKIVIIVTLVVKGRMYHYTEWLIRLLSGHLFTDSLIIVKYMNRVMIYVIYTVIFMMNNYSIGCSQISAICHGKRQCNGLVTYIKYIH